MTSTWVVAGKRSVAVLVGLLLIYCAWLAVHQGLADGIADDALTEMNSWDSAALDTAQVHSAMDLMLRANELDPGHPTYLHRLGRLSHVLMVLESAKRDVWAGRAKDYYRASLAVRPAWPLAWASLAQVKADLLELDTEMDLALTKATSLGPWEPGVLVMVTRIATAQGQFMNSDTRTVLAANVARGLGSPVGGVAAEIEGMLGDTVLNSELNPELNPELLAALEDLLVTSDWKRNPDQLMRVALQYYPLWKSASLDVIRTHVVSEVVSRPHTVQFVISKSRLIQLCPYLPRKLKLQKICQQA